MFHRLEKSEHDTGHSVPPPPYSIANSEQNGGIVLSTTGDVPGYEIVKNHGVVFGTTVRKGTNFSMWKSDGEKQQAKRDGRKGSSSVELYRLTNLVQTTREEAIDRMIEGVKATGANAACGLRFDSECIGQLGEISQVCCCATAVSVVPKEYK